MAVKPLESRKGVSERMSEGGRVDVCKEKVDRLHEIGKGRHTYCIR